MNRIGKAFENKKAFIGFLTGGDPTIEKTEEYIMEMIAAGADLIEIGIPFSDPIAEGPVIQAANIRALAAGTTTARIFELAAAVRRRTEVPLVFLTYVNPVFRYGYEAFFSRCEEVGVDGIIIPDLPFEERPELQQQADRHDVKVISMIAPTSENRIRLIAREAQGFVYVVSSMGVTGIRAEFSADLSATMKLLKEETKTPCAIGFGIHTPQQAKAQAQLADGVIVGSAIVKIIAEHGSEAGPYVREYVADMKAAIS